MTRYNFMGESFDFLKENKWIKRMALGLAILFITMTITGSLADHFTPSYTTYETTYEQILRMYLKMINRYGKKNNERHDLFNDAVYGGYDPENGDEAIINMTKRDAGYMLYDVNQDGIDELLIGTGGSWLYEVYTMDNGRVRELIRAGAYGTASSVYSCALLSDGRLFRFAHDGAALDYYEIWQMNGTGEASFVEGYHTDIIWDSETEDGIGVWYRSYAPFTKISDSSQTRVKDSIAEKWVRTQEQNIFDKKFVPFSIYEKYPDDPWNIAVISVKGSTETTAKVKIRKEAESNAKLVATKPAGTYVRVISQEGEYFRISFGNKEGFVQQQYLTPLTYEIQPGNNTAVYDDTATRETAEGQSKQANGTEENDQDVVAEDGDTYPANGKTNVGKVNIRSEMNKKSKLVATVQKKGTSVTVLGENADSDGVMWYKIGYNQKEGYVRRDEQVVWNHIRQPGPIRLIRT